MTQPNTEITKLPTILLVCLFIFLLLIKSGLLVFPAALGALSSITKLTFLSLCIYMCFRAIAKKKKAVATAFFTILVTFLSLNHFGYI